MDCQECGCEKQKVCKHRDCDPCEADVTSTLTDGLDVDVASAMDAGSSNNETVASVESLNSRWGLVPKNCTEHPSAIPQSTALLDITQASPSAAQTTQIGHDSASLSESEHSFGTDDFSNTLSTPQATEPACVPNELQVEASGKPLLPAGASTTADNRMHSGMQADEQGSHALKRKRKQCVASQQQPTLKKKRRCSIDTKLGSALKPCQEKRVLLPRRARMEWRVGAKLEAMDFQKNCEHWYTSRIVSVDEQNTSVLIHFDGWNSKFDQWISMKSDNLRPLASSKEVCTNSLPKVNWQELKVGTVVLGKWSSRKYPAKVVHLLPKKRLTIEFYDGVQVDTDLNSVQTLNAPLQQEALHIWDVMKATTDFAEDPCSQVNTKFSRRASLEINKLHKAKMDAAEVLLSKLVERCSVKSPLVSACASAGGCSDLKVDQSCVGPTVSATLPASANETSDDSLISNRPSSKDDRNNQTSLNGPTVQSFVLAMSQGLVASLQPALVRSIWSEGNICVDFSDGSESILDMSSVYMLSRKQQTDARVVWDTMKTLATNSDGDECSLNPLLDAGTGLGSNSKYQNKLDEATTLLSQLIYQTRGASSPLTDADITLSSIVALTKLKNKSAKSYNKPTEPNNKSAKPNSKPAKSDSKPAIPDIKPAKSDRKPAIPDNKPAKSDRKPAIPDNKPAKSDSKPAIPDSESVKSDRKPDKSDGKLPKSDSKPAISDSKPAKLDCKSDKSGSKPTKSNSKPTTSDSKPDKSDSKPAKSDHKPAISDRKSAKSASKLAKSDRKPAKSASKPAKSDKTPDKSNNRPAKLKGMKVPVKLSDNECRLRRMKNSREKRTKSEVSKMKLVRSVMVRKKPSKTGTSTNSISSKGWKVKMRKAPNSQHETNKNIKRLTPSKSKPQSKAGTSNCEVAVVPLDSIKSRNVSINKVKAASEVDGEKSCVKLCTRKNSQQSAAQKDWLPKSCHWTESGQSVESKEGSFDSYIDEDIKMPVPATSLPCESYEPKQSTSTPTKQLSSNVSVILTPTSKETIEAHVKASLCDQLAAASHTRPNSLPQSESEEEALPADESLDSDMFSFSTDCDVESPESFTPVTEAQLSVEAIAQRSAHTKSPLASLSLGHSATCTSSAVNDVSSTQMTSSTSTTPSDTDISHQSKSRFGRRRNGKPLGIRTEVDSACAGINVESTKRKVVSHQEKSKTANRSKGKVSDKTVGKLLPKEAIEDTKAMPLGYAVVLESVDAKPAKAFFAHNEHAQFRCTYCRKCFRKDSSLASHIKYKHEKSSADCADNPLAIAKSHNKLSTDREEIPAVCQESQKSVVNGEVVTVSGREGCLDGVAGGHLPQSHPPQSQAYLALSSHPHRHKTVSACSSDSEVSSIAPTTRKIRAPSSTLIKPTAEVDFRDEGSHCGPLDESSDDGSSYQSEVVNCKCGFNEEDNLMVQCDYCCCWQHAACFGINSNSLPEHYLCYVCLDTGGVRQSHKYIHHYYWRKHGMLPKLNGTEITEQDEKAAKLMKRSQKQRVKLQQKLSSLSSIRRLVDSAAKCDTYELALWSSDEEISPDVVDSTPSTAKQTENLLLRVHQRQNALQSDLDSINAIVSEIEKEVDVGNTSPQQNFNNQPYDTLLDGLAKIQLLTGLHSTAQTMVSHDALAQTQCDAKCKEGILTTQTSQSCK